MLSCLKSAGREACTGIMTAKEAVSGKDPERPAYAGLR